MSIVVKSVIGSDICMTREDGMKLYRAINEAVEYNGRVVVDFTGTRIFVSPFFNTAIGPFFERYSLDQLKDRVQIIHLKPSGEMVLNASIEAAIEYYRDEKLRSAIDDYLDDEGGRL